MPIKSFPEPTRTGPEGLLAVGGDLHPESLLLAYKQGIFPWPMDDFPLAWFCPPERAILDFSKLHLPRSLEQEIRRKRFQFTIDRDFPAVIRECAETKRPEQPGTWITPEMIDAYIELHRLGHAHSVEVWDKEELVGGIYGVDAGGAFAGESMFYKKSYASKLAIIHLVRHLQSRGLTWMDIQVMTPHMSGLGAEVISRDLFLRRLRETFSQGFRLF